MKPYVPKNKLTRPQKRELELKLTEAIKAKITEQSKPRKTPYADEVIAGEIEEFLSRHPKCEAFAEIFHYLRALSISEDTAADVAKSLLWAESKKGDASGQFQAKYSNEEFLAIFPDKAGASATGLEREATDTIGMSKASFYLFLRKHAKAGTIQKTPAGLWKKSK